MNKEMKDEPAKFSIGQTGIGSSSGGMAVLEGIVAALEVSTLPAIILSFPEANTRRCLTSYANPSVSLSVNFRYNSQIDRP